MIRFFGVSPTDPMITVAFGLGAYYELVNVFVFESHRGLLFGLI